MREGTRQSGGERDRLRELLDAVLDEDNQNLGEMAGAAYSSPFHFTRELTRRAGEPPMAMRRRVMLERANWSLRHGASVTEAAWQAGYESVEGFRRAYTRAYATLPSRPDDSRSATAHWLPAPNGIHFHPPTSLWVHTEEQAMNPLNELLVQHDLDDTRSVLDLAATVSPADLQRPLLPAAHLQTWTTPDDTLIAVLQHLVLAKDVWLAAVAGLAMPTEVPSELGAVRRRFEEVAPRWLELVRDIDRRQAWNDRVIDALCDPPESFVLAGILAHVLTFSAARRGLARVMLAQLLGPRGEEEGDPITWMRQREEENR